MKQTDFEKDQRNRALKTARFFDRQFFSFHDFVTGFHRVFTLLTKMCNKSVLFCVTENKKT